MSGNIWVVVEHWRGQLSEISFEVLALGRELAGELGVRLEAVLLGTNVRPLAAGLGAADSVLCAEHPALAELSSEACVAALAQLATARAPRLIMTPLTNVSLSLGTLLAEKLCWTPVNFCRNVRVSGGSLVAEAVLYGGKMEVSVSLPDRAVLGIWPGARTPDKGKSEKTPVIEEVGVDLKEPSAVRFLRYLEPEAGDVDISQQEVLVAVGRGIQSRENIELAEELARELGGAVCGSRPVIDQNWLPLARQVGKSGVTVKPKLYLAAGISGAPEHVEGLRGAELIVAVNTDPQAPIFDVARYGVVADALEFLPALTEAVRSRKQQQG